jgi:hypothetical protein
MPGTDIEPKPKAVSQDELVADIDRTRQELAATIDAISDRLNPANVARRTVERLRERAMQVDPVLAGTAAVAVAGAAIAYLLLRRRKRLPGALGQVLVLGRGQQVGR